MVLGDARLEDPEQDADQRILRRFDQLATWFEGAPTLVVDGGGTTVDVTIEDGEAPLDGILPTAYRREEGLCRRAVRAKMIERFSPAHRRRAEWFYRVGLWRGRTFEVGQPPLGTETVELDDAWYLSEAAGAVRVPMRATLEVAGYKSCPASERDCLVLMAELDPADEPLSESIQGLFRAEAASDEADGETGEPDGWVKSETRLLIVSDPATLRTYRMQWTREEKMHIWANRDAGQGIRLESRTIHRRRLVRLEDEAGGD
ncbi:MAG: hypothetical protein ABEK29_00670 [Bradymonadaceae bacterium]